MSKEKGFFIETIEKSKILDYIGIGYGVVTGSVGIVLLSIGLLLGKNQITQQHA